MIRLLLRSVGAAFFGIAGDKVCFKKESLSLVPTHD